MGTAGKIKQRVIHLCNMNNVRGVSIKRTSLVACTSVEQKSVYNRKAFWFLGVLL
jgi:hypothetical protein